MNGNFTFHNPTRLRFGENAMEFLKDELAAFGIPENLTPSFLLDVGYPQKGTAPNKMHFEKREVKDFATYK